MCARWCSWSMMMPKCGSMAAPSRRARRGTRARRGARTRSERRDVDLTREARERVVRLEPDPTCRVTCPAGASVSDRDHGLDAEHAAASAVMRASCPPPRMPTRSGTHGAGRGTGCAHPCGVADRARPFPLRPIALRVAAGQCAPRAASVHGRARCSGGGLECARSSRVSSPRRPRSSVDGHRTGGDSPSNAVRRTSWRPPGSGSPRSCTAAPGPSSAAPGSIPPASTRRRSASCCSCRTVVRTVRRPTTWCRWARGRAGERGGGGRAAVGADDRSPDAGRRARGSRPTGRDGGRCEVLPPSRPWTRLLPWSRCERRIGKAADLLDLLASVAIAADTLRAGWDPVDRVTGGGC